MAEDYGGESLSDAEIEKFKDEELSASLSSGLSKGTEYAALGASVGLAFSPVGSAIGAGVGFLVGGVAGFFMDDYDKQAEMEKAKQAKSLNKMTEDASRSAQAAADAASKGSGGGMRQASIPSGPSADSVLMSSMPIQAGASRPMDPYRQTVLNRFGWS